MKVSKISMGFLSFVFASQATLADETIKVTCPSSYSILFGDSSMTAPGTLKGTYRPAPKLIFTGASITTSPDNPKGTVFACDYDDPDSTSPIKFTQLHTDYLPGRC